jgi:hypothetical protein
VSVPINDGIYSRVHENDYHADRNSLSSSGAKTIITLTPAEYMAQLLEPRDPKPAYDFGHAAHKMVLGKGGDLVRVDAENWRTKVAQDARKKAWAHGKAPLLKAQIQQAQVMAGKVFANPIAAKLLESGSAELSGYWHDDATGVRLRFRPDFLPDVGNGRPIIVDYKTAKSANPKQFAKAAFDYGYYQQAAWYIDGLAETTGCTDAAFIFIVQQKDAPFLVSLSQLEPEDVDLGRQQNRRAIDIYARCWETGVWPGYEGIALLALPGWARRQIEDDLTA